MDKKSSEIIVCCSGCKAEFNLEQLSGVNRKVCPKCGYGLFMLFDKEENIVRSAISLNNLSKTQLSILNYIAKSSDDTGLTPTVEEIRDHLDLGSISTVYYHLNCLKQKGYITFKKGRTYTVKILPKVVMDKTNPLTDIQLKLLSFIDLTITETKQAPTTREMQNVIGVSSSATLSYHIDKLTEYGLIEKERYQHRSLVISEKGKFFLSTLKNKA